MNDISLLTTFFGWCSVLNIIFLMFCTAMLTLFRGFVMPIHARLSGVAEENLEAIYFNFLANYKLLTMLLSIVPYVALKLMG